MAYQLSSFESPESLFHQCLHYVVDNWKDCLIEKNSWPEKIELKKETSLPYQICDPIFELYLRKNVIIEPFLRLFENTENTKLRKIRIVKEHLIQQTKNIFPLLHHNLTELHYFSENMLSDSELSTFLELVNKNGENLKAFSCNEKIFASVIPTNRKDHYDFEDWEYVINAPDLEELTVSHFFQICTPVFFHKLITPLKKLKHLRIISVPSEQEFLFLCELPNLTSLTIHNIHVSDNGFSTIRTLSQLKHLDISVIGPYTYGDYPLSNLILASLIESLPNLVSLDISGTNLDEDIMQALQPRINNPLEFLGLYKTYNDACTKNGIPAKRIAGDANVEQLLNAGYSFFEKTEMMRRILHDLRYVEDSIEHDHLLKFLLKIVDRHPELGFECQAIFIKILESGNPLSVKAKRHLLRVTANMVIKDGLKLDTRFIPNYTSEELFHDVKLLGELVISLIDTIMNKLIQLMHGVNEFCEVVFQILELADENQKELLGINAGVIKALITRIRSARGDARKGWKLLEHFINDHLANSKFFLQEGILLFEEVMEYLLDHPGKGLREMERILIIFNNLALLESIWSEYLKHEKNFICLLIRALNFSYGETSHVNYYAGCILLNFLTYKVDKSSIVEQMRDQILEDVRHAISQKLSPFFNHFIHRRCKDLHDTIIRFISITKIPEYKYWAVIGMTWSYPAYRALDFFSNRDFAVDFLKEIIQDESVPATVRDKASFLYMECLRETD